MNSQDSKVLVYGYGNPGRQDDGLGIIVSEEIEKWCNENNYSNIEISQNYQLNIEDAERIAHFNLVIFIDACKNIEYPYEFEKVKTSLETEFSMHSVSPSFILGLSIKLFNADIKAYQLKIRGAKWEFMEKLSDEARVNADLAFSFLKKELTKYKVCDKILT
jgi:hydrogenase maturation protease